MTIRAGLESRLRDARFLLREAGHWPASLGVLVAGIVLLPFLPLGVGLYAVPRLLGTLNRLAAGAQGRAAAFTSAVIPFDRRRLSGRHSFGELAALVSAPETKRDAAWLGFHSAFALLAGVLALALPVGGVLYILVAPFWPLFPADAPLELTLTVRSWTDAVLTMLLGLVYVAAGWLLLPWMARRVGSATLAILSPRRYADLARRISELSAARASALAAHAAELRRIERELHDGAQNRLVGVVMMLGLAQRAAETDPAAAVPFLGRAQDAASEALAGLRAAVHDIYPPVLDELGLGGAASALTSRSSIPCSLNVTGLQRAPAAVESAAYFVLAEALTNAAKHSNASRIDVVLRTEAAAREEILVVQVDDDGDGGARVADARVGDARAGDDLAAGSDRGGSGTGLAGIARRAAAFGGKLILTSPPGGPTHLRVELPCAF
ncbi:sensor histidine kinase [Arthrobacter yangruifuii]|uniref:histidine kinase n=1 Tax=Arthrobacter yangruifuii TaxID=2606616 RepID=A0A5N6MEG6_9MICC|nr:histidine kinase [Arthrobacter yangruifuii]KAD3455929.1 sensor histidine kinase [Arthrobacter yangruifuii]